MRRLLLSSKKIPFSAGPPGSRHCHSLPILSNRLNSIAGAAPPCTLAPPDSLVFAASLPFALTPLCSCAVPVGLRRSGAAIFAGLNPPIGSLATDRIVGGTQSPGRGGLNKSTLAAFLPGQYPQATWVAFILATLYSI